MNGTILGALMRQTGRNVRRGGLPFMFATVMIGLGLFAVSAFATLLVNFERVSESVGSAVGAVAFLDVDSAVKADALRKDIAAVPGVAEARLVSPDEALARVSGQLGEDSPVLVDGAGLKMPWIVEVARDLTAGATSSAIYSRIERMDGVESVMHPGEEVERLEALGRLLRVSGLFLLGLIALVTVLVVSNTVKLTVMSRADEIAIQKLVGATDGFVRLPFLLEGLLQGVLGAALALAALAGLHASLAALAEVALSGAFGTFTLAPLPPIAALYIALAGATLGMVGAALSVRRFLRI